MKVKRLPVFVLMTGLLFLAACAGMYGIKIYTPSAPTLNDGKFAVSFDTKRKPSSGGGNKDYFFAVTVENISDKEGVFDTGDMEIKDTGTGISYFSMSKGASSVSFTGSQTDVLTKVNLKPGQKTEGRLWFITPAGKANAEKFELKMGKASITFGS